MTDKLKVYVETSFVCYLTGDQTTNAKISADQAYTRQWWSEEKDVCDVYCGNNIRKISEHADKAYEAFLARTRAA